MNLVRLTDGTSQRGAVWYASKQKVGLGFETTFTFKITNPAGPGADGLAFVIQDYLPNVVGEIGCDIGYGLIPKSLAVEIDTYANPAGATGCINNDPNDRHVAIQSNGINPNSGSHGASTLGSVFTLPFDPGPSESSGIIHTVTIRYVAATRKLTVLVDGSYTTQAILPQALSTYLGLTNNEAYVGFTAATALYGEIHDILSWRLITGSSPDTIGMYQTNPTPRSFKLRNSNSAGSPDVTVDVNALTQVNDIRLTGDWDGDGIDSVGWYRPSGGAFYLSNSNSSPSVDYSFTFGVANLQPFVGDWDGDGRDGVGVYNATTSQLFLRNALTTGYADYTLVFGISGDVAIAGDWNGDGIDTVGLHRPSTGNFFTTNLICNCAVNSAYINSFGFGIANDIALAGDWNNDALAGIGVFRPSNGTVYLRNSINAGYADIQFAYGGSSDKPVAGRWLENCILPPNVNQALLSGTCPLQIPPTSTPVVTITQTNIPTGVPSNCTITLVAQDPNSQGATSLNLRESPTRKSPILTTIPWSTGLTAIYRIESTGQTNNDIWYKVTYNGQEGWISARYANVIYVNNINCSLPLPYAASWVQIAQILPSEIPGGCDIGNYLRTEDPALVLARVTYAEAALFTVGGTVYEDAYRISWIIRLNAFMGLPNYKPLSRAGASVSIIDEILSGAFEPISTLQTGLVSNGCNPSALTQENVRKMVYPQNRSHTATPTVDIGSGELFELWRIYQNIRNDVYQRPWTNIRIDIKGYDQFKGVVLALDTCASTAGLNGLVRPGPGYTWAANQPYPPKSVYGYQVSSPAQSSATCYQDAYHLDDLFFDALQPNTTAKDLPQQPSTMASDTFPAQFPVIVLVNPSDTSDCYSLAQLTGMNPNGSKWPDTVQPICT